MELKSQYFKINTVPRMGDITCQIVCNRSRLPPPCDVNTFIAHADIVNRKHLLDGLGQLRGIVFHAVSSTFLLNLCD